MNLVCPSSPGRATIVDDAPDEVLAAAWLRTADLVEGRLSATGVPV
jgi:hypothetical protein